MNYPLVFSYLKIVKLLFLITVDNDLRGISRDECSISSEKIKVTQFARLCKIMTWLIHSFVLFTVYSD